VAGLAVTSAGLSVIAMLGFAKSLWAVFTGLEKVAVTCCALGLMTTIVPVLYWMPTYDKLWLQPLAFLFFGAGVLLNVALRTDMQTRGVRYLVWWSCALVFAVGLLNLGRVAHIGRPTPYFSDAQEVANLLRSKDLLVGDWNEVFLLYQAFWMARGNSFNVPTEAQRSGLTTMSQLGGAVARTREAGGEVFFLGILDLSDREWKMLLGERRGLPYNQFDGYRRCAVIVKSFPYHGHVITLRQLDSCTAQSMLKP
jgi:hypothetical protein